MYDDLPIKRYRGRWLLVAIAFVLEAPIVAALAVAAVVTRVLLLLAQLAGRRPGSDT